MRTLPLRKALVIRDTTRRGWSRSRRSAKARAWSLACSEVTPEIGAYSCRPLPPEVLASGTKPSDSSSGRRSSATRQQSTMLAGAPGSRSKTSRSGGRMSGIRHIGTCSSRPARLADQRRGGGVVEERLAVHALRVALKGDRPPGDVRYQHGRHPLVEVEHLGLGEPG